jgi:PAS domain S-box-containing protein
MNTSTQAQNGQRPDTNANSLLESDVAARFGLVPNFFRLASSDPTITRNLWGFAQFAYLDNSMPSLFKERLFVYLSRFCDVRYCIARHVGFLVGLGRVAGDASCFPQTVEAVLPLLKMPLARGETFEFLLASCQDIERPLQSFPEPDSAIENVLFACGTHLFLQTPDKSRALYFLQALLSPSDLEHLKVFLSFVRTAHYWTKLHPELVFEDDVQQLLEAHEALATCILNDPEAFADGLSQRITKELASLQELRIQNAAMTEAYDMLVTDYHGVEQKLQDREANLRELVSSIPAAVYASDIEGRTIYYNRQAAELSGCEPLLNKSTWRFLDAHRLHDRGTASILPADAPMNAVLASGEAVVNRELVLERPDASRIDVLVNIAPLRDPLGHVTGAVSILQDISELKRAQHDRERLLEELERSNQDLSQFSYAVSHDLQGPVRSIRSLTKLLIQRSDGLPENASHLAALIEQAGEGMERLIDSLLRYAQAGQGELSRQRVSAEATVDAVRVSLGALIAKTGARISTIGLPDVDADPVLLQQLFQNLIANGIKYHRQGEAPVIEIHGESIPEGWRFAIKDNGEGVLPKHRALIFEALKRLHGNDTPGSGLGLALCKTIVGRHGGRIWVESEGVGHGATFFFTLAGTAPKSSAVV